MQSEAVSVARNYNPQRSPRQPVSARKLTRDCLTADTHAHISLPPEKVASRSVRATMTTDPE